MDLTIDRVETIRIDLPTRRPHRVVSSDIEEQQFLFVRVHTGGGHVGVGEAGPPGGPWWGGESAETCRAIVEDYFVPLLEGARVDRPGPVKQQLDRVAHDNPFAKAAVEVAMLDAWGRARDVPVSTLLGGRYREEIPVHWGLSAEDVEAVRDEVAVKKEAGHRAFKLKMGAQPADTDVARVRRIVDEIGPDCSVVVDPNGVWDEPTARRAVNALEAAGVDWIEQPVAQDNLDAMARLTAGRTTAKILADESAETPSDAFEIARRHAADAVAVKVGKSGGLRSAQRMAAAAEAGGLVCYGGTALESSINTAAALHLFAALPTLADCELIGPALLEDDLVTEPLTPTNGTLRVPDGPGLGVQVDEDTIEHYR